MKKTLILVAMLGMCSAATAFANPQMSEADKTAPASTGMMVDQALKMMDANGDGMISQDEHTAASDAMFKATDTDANGMMSPAEMTVMANADMAAMNMPVDATKTQMMIGFKMAMMDTDKDGMVSASENTAAHKAMFTGADANSDGMLSKDELTAAMSKMTAH